MKRRVINLALAFVALSSLAWCGEQRDLDETARKWAAVFHMTDWRIEVQAVSLDDLQCEEKCVAKSVFSVAERRGWILVLKRSEYSPDIRKRWSVRSPKADQRDSVVHELLHCVVEDMYTEAAVQVITKALKP